MLYTYHFRAKDGDSDRGVADVTIVASNVIEAGEMLSVHLKELKRFDLKFKMINEQPYFQGVVSSTVESR